MAEHRSTFPWDGVFIIVIWIGLTGYFHLKGAISADVSFLCATLTVLTVYSWSKYQIGR